MSVELFECVALSEGKVTVDRQRGTIGPVRVLGWKSLNGREYDPAGVDPKVYEAKKVCVDHVRPGQSRSTRDTIGVLEGCHKKANGVYAERLRLFHPAGEYEQRLMGAAEIAPHAYGLSHTARGREKAGSGGAVIEAVEHVSTVDLVDDPATVTGLFESRDHAVKVKDLIESLKVKRPKYAKALQEMAEAGVVSPDAQMDAPPDAPAGDADHETALKQGFRAAINAALDDDGMDMKAKLSKIKEILAAQEKLLKKGGGDSGDAAGGDEPGATEESRKLKAENGRLLAEKEVRKAAGKAGVALTEALVEALARPGMTEAQATAVVAELKGSGAPLGQRPRSATPFVPPGEKPGGSQNVQESKLPDGADAKAVGKWLMGK